MGIDAGIEFGLRHLFANRAVGVEAMHRDATRNIVRYQQIFTAAIDAGMDRSRRQFHGRTD